MRTRKIIIMMGVLAGAVVLSSCKAEDKTPGGRDAVTFTSGIDRQATPTKGATRASGSFWAANDAIGIYMVKNGTTDIAESASNMEHVTTTGNGTFTPAAGSQIYYPLDGTSVDFIAYYPFDEDMNFGVNDVQLPVSQFTETQDSYDLLWAKADGTNGGGYNKVANFATPVSLVFSHKLARLVMNVSIDFSVGNVNPDDITVVIDNMNTATTFDTVTGAMGAPSNPMVTTPAEMDAAAGFDASYSSIIIPDSYEAADDIKVQFTVNGETFTWNVGAAAFEGGNEYTYAVTVTRTGVKATGTINPWITEGNDRGNVEAD